MSIMMEIDPGNISETINSLTEKSDRLEDTIINALEKFDQGDTDGAEEVLRNAIKRQV